MKHSRILSSVLILLTCCMMTHTIHAQQETPDLTAAPQSLNNIQGIWVWRFDSFATPDQRDELIGFCKTYDINLLMVQIHTVKHKAILRDADALAALISQAADHNIKVEALEGGPEMAEKKNLPSTLARLKMILDFNQSLPTGKKLVGIHYDIEPYTSPLWKKDMDSRQSVMTNLLDFAHIARKQLDAQTPAMTLAFDIPFWYDNKTKPDDNCVLTYNGQSKNLYQHLIDVSDYIGIMSYRQTAKGSNGVLAHVQNELDYARTVGKKITPALETIELKSSPTITFFGKTPQQFWTQHNLIRQELKNDPAFGGVLTHCYYGMKDLLENE
ncbi:MAG: hypothetical protein CMJ19_25145 [Phycisphaeraceae bacterium]|nr:hypothetical protein [Phycisphaeraceae bacterium]